MKELLRRAARAATLQWTTNMVWATADPVRFILAVLIHASVGVGIYAMVFAALTSGGLTAAWIFASEIWNLVPLDTVKTIAAEMQRQAYAYGDGQAVENARSSFTLYYYSWATALGLTYLFYVNEKRQGRASQ